jgi:transcriptional regulator with XRE-family HTH domain
MVRHSNAVAKAIASALVPAPYAGALGSRSVGDFGDINSPAGPLQRRLAAHLRRIYVKNRYESQSDMAARTGINQGQISAIMRGSRAIGLENLLKLWAVAHESLDYLVSDDPSDPQWFVLGLPKSARQREEEADAVSRALRRRSLEPEPHPTPRQPIASAPSSASSSPRPARRTKGGGQA